MKLEEFGTPLPAESPERRYASLHRTIEAGQATDKTWHDLVHTCLTLRKPDEALTAAGCIDDPALRERAQRLLLSQGAQGQQRVTPVSSAVRAPIPQTVPPDTIRENVLDAFRFLFTDQMPLIVIFATLTFPLVVGLGGFLTKDSQFFVFPLIALIPALSVVGLIGALGRRILLDASRGLDDPPKIPNARELAREALRFLRDFGALGAIFLGPAILSIALGIVSGFATFATLAAGAYLLPMALATRQVTEDWRAISPNVLFRAITLGGLRYAAVAGCAFALFTPAGLSAYCATGAQLYLQLSVVGPLTVAPLFVVARLLGQLLFTKRVELECVLGERELPREAIVTNEVQKTVARRPSARAKARPSGQQRRAQSAAPAHPEATRVQRIAPDMPPPAQPRGTKQRPTTQPQPQRHPQSQQRPQQAPKQPDARPAPKPSAYPHAPEPGTAARATGARKRRAAAPVAAGVGVGPLSVRPDPAPRPVLGEDLPDLSNMPGMRVLTGKDRERAGAASVTKQR